MKGYAAGDRGFTLLEMSLVLAIIGLVVGGGLVAFGPIIQEADATQTRSNMDQVEAALSLFVIQNNRMPCPADGGLTPASTNYGRELVDTGNSPNTCTAAAAHAVIPWVTLGVDESYSLDGWNHRLSYFPAGTLIAGVDTLVSSASSPQSGCLQRTTGSSTLSDAANCYAISGATTGCANSYPYGNYITVYSINTTTNPASLGAELTNDSQGAPSGISGCQGSSGDNVDTAGYGLRAAYVLISHGQTGWYGWGKNGTQILPSNSNYTLKLDNNTGAAGTAGNLGFVQGPTLGSSTTLRANTNYFDDIVRWRSPSYLIQLCGSGACGNP